MKAEEELAELALEHPDETREAFLRLWTDLGRVAPMLAPGERVEVWRDGSPIVRKGPGPPRVGLSWMPSRMQREGIAVHLGNAVLLPYDDEALRDLIETARGLITTTADRDA